LTLEATEAECAANAVAPRISLKSMEDKISAVYYFTGQQAVVAADPHIAQYSHMALDVLTICLLVMENGFILVGKSAPASAANFNAELGAKLAYEDAIRQLWPLEGYLLRTKLTEDK
jgi:hypothetical protein